MIVTEVSEDAFAMACHDFLGACGSERVPGRDFFPSKVNCAAPRDGVIWIAAFPPETVSSFLKMTPVSAREALVRRPLAGEQCRGATTSLTKKYLSTYGGGVSNIV
jgi:hypothetical protein